MACLHPRNREKVCVLVPQKHTTIKEDGIFNERKKGKHLTPFKFAFKSLSSNTLLVPHVNLFL